MNGTSSPTVNNNVIKMSPAPVEEIDKGQPCYKCMEKCGGFKPHPWR